MKRFSNVGLIVLALAVGVAAGWLSGALRKGEGIGCALAHSAAVRQKQPEAVDKAAADKVELDALRRRMKDLEREIAATVAPKAIDAKDFSKIVFRNGNIRYDGGVTLADIRKEDPERYKDIVDWLKTNKENHLKALPKLEAYLAKFDLSRLPDEMRHIHESHMERYSKYVKTWERINPDDDSLTMGELAAFNFENSDRAIELGFIAKEEDAVLKWLVAEKRAREMGYSDEDAAALAYALRDYDYITRIVF